MHASAIRRIRGRLRLVGPGLCRTAENMVVRGGARLVAGRLIGEDIPPIDTLRLGFAREAGDPEIAALTPPDPPLDDELLSAPVAPDSFAVTEDLDGLVRISVAAEFEPGESLSGVSEAGLFAGDRLYNHVLFEPVDLTAGQRVTFFWDIDIPFGD